MPAPADPESTARRTIAGPPLPGITLGCDYNPEQWDPAVWPEDLRLMREVGVSLVAINVFGWAQLQRPDHTFDFSMLDRVLDQVHAAGIRVNLGTGTASPPPWLSLQEPSILPVAVDGTTRYPGGRQAWCPSSPVFRRAALELTAAVAERYGRHPALALWHVSNELGCHNALCYCEVSAERFREWLRERYGSIDEVNAAWGTAFWSQRYYDWAEIHTPRLTLSTRNPGQVLDFHRFSSDELLSYYRAERDVLRRFSDAPVTTNLMVTTHIRNLDYWSWAPELDLIANDHYRDNRLADPVGELAFCADLTRGLAGGEPWALMETAPGAVNWQPVNLAREPGELTRDVLTHVARGADTVCFFQWRASRQGAEKFHSALLPHAGTDSAIWQEVTALGRALRRLAPVAGSRVSARVAMLFSWQAQWVADGENRPSELVGYGESVRAMHRALLDCGVSVDVVEPGADLTGYDLVVVPSLHLVGAADTAAVAAALARGAHLLVTRGTAIVDENDRIPLGGFLAPWRELLGVDVEEFTPLPAGVAAALDSGARAWAWAERLRVTDAQVVASFAEGPAAGRPVIVRRPTGAGALAWYLGAELAGTDLAQVVRAVLDGAGLAPAPGAGDGVDVVRRVGEGEEFVFVVNRTDLEQQVPIVGDELISAAPADGIVRVPPGAVRVVRRRTAPRG